MSYPRSGGRILVDQLAAHGTELVFCVPGESYLAALDALFETPQIRLIVCRMEAGASNMACAYGQLTGRPGVCFVTRGPGAAHAMVGVHTARQGSVPMVLLVGQVPRAHQGREAFQEVDIPAVFGPIAKWAATVEDARRIPEYLSRAFHVALAGRPGPVVLALPEDVLADTVDVGDGAPHQVIRPTAPPAMVTRVRDIIARSERPLALVGGGGWDARTAADVTALCERWNLPVATAFRRQDYVDNRSPVFCGTLGLGMDPRLAARAHDADVLLAIGARLDEPTTGGYQVIQAPRPRQALIHVHADPDELGRVFEPVLGLNAGSGEFAGSALTLDAPDSRRWASWTEAAAGLGRAVSSPAPVDGTLDLAQAISDMCDRLPPDTIVTNGAGNYTLWCHRFWRFRQYGTQVAPVSGAMGFGVPAGIAAKLARPDSPVLSFNGDGCFLMCGQELATAVRHDAAVVFVVIDNRQYGTIRMHQERHYPGRAYGTELVNPDFVALAHSFGVEAGSVAQTEELVESVRSMIDAGRPGLIHVPLPAEMLTPPRPAAAQALGARTSDPLD
jgi:acetolactate synthase-1/2/3 large subunit